MNYRLFPASLLLSVITACSGHQVPNKEEVARLIKHQLISNTVTQKALADVDPNSLGGFDCKGNGVIAVCKFDIDGHYYEQIYGHSKYGWTGRSSAYSTVQ